MLPRFSLRVAMLLLTAAALLSLVIRAALQQAPWAIGILAGVASLGVTLVVHSLFYSLARLFEPRSKSASCSDASQQEEPQHVR